MTVAPESTGLSSESQIRPETAEKKKQEPRNYVILRKTNAASPNERALLSHEGTVKALSAEQAIRLFVSTSEVESGTFVAITERSFKPLTVETETKTQLKFS